MPTDRGMQPSHWAKYLNQLADRLEKVGPSSIVTGDPRALRDAAKAIEELAEGPKTPGLDAESRARAEAIYSRPSRANFDKLRLELAAEIVSLRTQLQEGIDGGHRAKAELDERITRLDNHLVVRIEKLEDKAGSIGEWQEAVDERLAELTGEIKAILERLAEQSRSQDDLHRRLLGLAKIAGPSGWGSDTMTEFVNQLTALETSVLRIETALGNVGSDTTNLSEDWRAWHHMDPVAAEEWARERAPEERPAAKRVRLTYYDEGGKNLYSVYVNRGYNTMPPGLVLQRTHRIEVS